MTRGLNFFLSVVRSQWMVQGSRVHHLRNLAVINLFNCHQPSISKHTRPQDVYLKTILQRSLRNSSLEYRASQILERLQICSFSSRSAVKIQTYCLGHDRYAQEGKPSSRGKDKQDVILISSSFWPRQSMSTARPQQILEAHLMPTETRQYLPKANKCLQTIHLGLSILQKGSA